MSINDWFIILSSLLNFSLLSLDVFALCLCQFLLWFSLTVWESILEVKWLGCGHFVTHLLGFLSCKMFDRLKRPLVLAFQNTIWSIPFVLSETVFVSFEICYLRSDRDNAYKQLFSKLLCILDGSFFVNDFELGVFLFFFSDLFVCGLLLLVLNFVYMIFRIWNVRFVVFLL